MSPTQYKDLKYEAVNSSQTHSTDLLKDPILKIVFDILINNSPNTLSTIPMVSRNWAKILQEPELWIPNLRECTPYELKQACSSESRELIAKTKPWLQYAPTNLRIEAFCQKDFIPMIGYVESWNFALKLNQKAQNKFKKQGYSFDPNEIYVPLLLTPPELENIKEVEFSYTEAGEDTEPKCIVPYYFPYQVVQEAIDNKKHIFVLDEHYLCQIKLAPSTQIALDKLKKKGVKKGNDSIPRKCFAFPSDIIKDPSANELVLKAKKTRDHIATLTYQLFYQNVQ